MLDIGYIRENTKTVEDSIRRRGLKVDLNKLLKLDEQRRELVKRADDLRSQLKQDGKPSPDQVKKLQTVKSDLEKADKELAKIESEFNELVQQVPNVLAEGTPEGGEEDKKEEKATDKPKLDFKPKDHQTLAEANGWLDFERGAKVAGNKFYYLKGALVKLEQALLKMAMDMLEQQQFELMAPPHMVRSRIAEGTGFVPRGEEEDHEYRIEGEDLRLIGTAEVPLTGYHADEILETDQLPRLYAGISPSYRKEAGAYGKHSKGLFRVHQFDKLEMYVLCEPKDSESWHKKILELEEKICNELKIPYRVVRIAAGDLGAPAYKKYDLEYWSPVDNDYRELTSCSNCTDYQARNLDIKYRAAEGKTEFVHTLNGTAIAFSRTLIALLENHQQSDGTVALPPALHKYYGKGGL